MRVDQSFVDAVAHKANNIIDLAFAKVETGELPGNQCVFLTQKIKSAMRRIDAATCQPDMCIDAYASLSIAYCQACIIGDRELFSQVGSLQRYVGSYIKEQIRIQSWKEEESTNGKEHVD